MVHRSILRREAERAQLNIAEHTQDKLQLYCEMVLFWNRRVNLTGLEGEEFVRRLVIDPIWIAEYLRMEGVLTDVGSGNGSPAIPMTLARNWTLTQMVESRTKRAVFLRQVVAELGLGAVVVHKGRFEDIVSELRPTDWITLQAVAPEKDILKTARLVMLPTTRIVWITSVAAGSAIVAESRVQVPFSDSQAVILSLDPI